MNAVMTVDLSELDAWSAQVQRASDDLTGNARLGGDWQLEYATGGIEADVAVDQSFQQDWMGLLAISTNSTSSGVTSRRRSGPAASRGRPCCSFSNGASITSSIGSASRHRGRRRGSSFATATS